ncbi:MAG: hypothetical protein KGQ79_09595 [Proteobacteria bacterium]|nr:hypothetical protein [Pseudomonadota bacterium]
MSRALGQMLLMMFAGFSGAPEQDLREQPEPQVGVEQRPGKTKREAKPSPSSPARHRYHLAFP